MLLFAAGAVGYCGLEVFWRGRTHGSMAVAGGVCLAAMGRIDARMRDRPLALRALASAGAITACELAVGLLVNRALKLRVWDYARLPGNVMGQICPQYAALWFALSLAVLPVRRNPGPTNHRPTA